MIVKTVQCRRSIKVGTIWWKGRFWADGMNQGVDSRDRVNGMMHTWMSDLWFLPCDAMHPVSVRPSVTFVSYAKTTKGIFEIFSPSGSQAIIEFYALVNLKPQWLVIKNRAVEAETVEADYRQIVCSQLTNTKHHAVSLRQLSFLFRTMI